MSRLAQRGTVRTQTPTRSARARTFVVPPSGTGDAVCSCDRPVVLVFLWGCVSCCLFDGSHNPPVLPDESVVPPVPSDPSVHAFHLSCSVSILSSSLLMIASACLSKQLVRPCHSWVLAGLSACVWSFDAVQTRRPLAGHVSGGIGRSSQAPESTQPALWTTMTGCEPWRLLAR